MYNVGPTSSTLVQHCTNVMQMFCVYWERIEADVYKRGFLESNILPLYYCSLCQCPSDNKIRDIRLLIDITYRRPTVVQGQTAVTAYSCKVSSDCCLILHCVMLTIASTNPANTTRWNTDVLMLGQRRRRWANIKTALFQRVVFAGKASRTSSIYYSARAEVYDYLWSKQILPFGFTRQ